MTANTALTARQTLRQALWNLRWPGLVVLGPMGSLVLINLFFGLPGQLWLLAGGFFLFSLVLFGILVRGEYKQLRQPVRRR
jgi:hypothetical protein